MDGVGDGIRGVQAQYTVAWESVIVKVDEATPMTPARFFISHDMRTWQVERRNRTRHLIELGGLVVKAGSWT
jgi:hypothetical protein